jgi:hypothetical protein
VRTIEIESWAARIIAGVQSGATVEDSRVELKAELPEPTKAARRIAAHANGASSEPILWLIGVDEDKGVVGIKGDDLAAWFPKVKAAFDGVYPPLRDVAITVNGSTILCLLFDTSRAPFMVKNPVGGSIQREIPWREGTTTRTATRDEVLRIVHPEDPSPTIEILAANLRATPQKEGDLSLEGRFKVYLVPKNEQMLVIPFHRCSAQVLHDGKIVCDGLDVEIHKLRRLTTADIRSVISRMRGHESRSVTIKREADAIEVEDYQAVFYRPAMFTMAVSGKVDKNSWGDLRTPTVQVAMRSASNETKTFVIAVKFPSSESGSFTLGQSWL